ncbi:TetR family transcriptional regulator [Peribacillus muralis]|uniref:TetR/AcrR family transcriptional regulator n=1 Tax=Peribacillus muralis TaxID=264697 RepID=UPI001F4DE3FB|nr:TetR/AcrR family transcriptional regulator [Peribacillus muralis]MCK1992227.1 TetR family transcriptional regulator [Peribacillus muralis]MCK2012783.1 TetR family transcriptional regulator [Peribacillus muralis]
MITAVNKRDSIVSSALELFAERGYDATTIPMIATKAGVGAGTIYRYFENKEVLGNKIFQGYVDIFTATIKNGFPYEESIRNQFHHIFKSMVHFTNEQDQALYFIKIHSGAHFLNEESHTSFQCLLDLFKNFFDSGKERKEIKELPSSALIAIIYGAFLELQRLVRIGELVPEAKLLADVEESFWDAVRLHS